MKLKIDIKSNAIDSFNEALAKFNNAQQGIPEDINLQFCIYLMR